MQISNSTIEILKNFSTINNNILFKPGNRIRTMNIVGNIFAEAIIDEEFPREFGIYDLNQFLNGLTILYEPELIFNHEKYLLISEGNAKTKYFFSDPRMIVSPPDKELHMPSEDVEFEITKETLDKLKKVSLIYNLPDFSVVGEDGQIKVLVRNKKDATSNEFSLEVGDTTNDFVFNFKMENLKFMSGPYKFTISNALIAKIEHLERNLIYWISPEPDSES